uniref:Secreted protein n=1 Tax=Thraustotheca clavata TaxID=74557 RepID=A0A0A7CLZ4_9STRA|nr:secreted protein [Thraustotheca clavata]
MKFITLSCLTFLGNLAVAKNQQQFKTCQTDFDCNSDFHCQVTTDGTFSMCQPGARPTRRIFVCSDQTNFHGDDIMVQNLNFRACLSRCEAYEDCNAITWIAETDQGECRLKHLVDPMRQATTDDRPMKSCKAVMINWVFKPNYQLQGPVLTKLQDQNSMRDCMNACMNSDQCGAVTFYKHHRTCVLNTRARNYIPVSANTPNIDAISAIRHGYRACFANGNLKLGDVTINFIGTFQDCNKCISSHKSNAFAWLMICCLPSQLPSRATTKDLSYAWHKSQILLS